MLWPGCPSSGTVDRAGKATVDTLTIFEIWRQNVAKVLVNFRMLARLGLGAEIALGVSHGHLVTTVPRTNGAADAAGGRSGVGWTVSTTGFATKSFSFHSRKRTRIAICRRESCRGLNAPKVQPSQTRTVCSGCSRVTRVDLCRETC